MTASSLILGLAERTIRLACWRLPQADRDERYREWTAELPAILHDPDVRPAPRRTLRVLLFALDQHRGIRLSRPKISRVMDVLAGSALTLFVSQTFGGGTTGWIIAFLILAGIIFTERWRKVPDPRDEEVESP